MDFNNSSENNINDEINSVVTGSTPVQNNAGENAVPSGVNATPIAPTVNTTPVVQPADTTPVVQPVNATPVVQPADATPVVQPVNATPVVQPVNATPVNVEPVLTNSEAAASYAEQSAATERVVEAAPVRETVYAAKAEAVESEKSTKKRKEKKEKKGGRFFLRLLTAALVGVLFGGCAAGAWYLTNKYLPKEAAAVTETAEAFDKDAYKREIEKDLLEKLKSDDDASIVKSVTTESNVTMQVTDVSDVVEDVMPSVVSITNKYTSVMNYWGRQYEEEGEASGSGIIIGENDTELLIATNNHVIDGAKELYVQFIDGESVAANVKGADADNDIAVIAVSFDAMKDSTKDAIEIASLGDSEDLKVGEPAIAIGNALGYGQSVTTGVISALDRTLELEDGTESEGFIQTDAAINPGNSGGALLNVKGEVVGINSNKIGGSSVEGMGYAIPISRALPIIDNLKTKKTKSGINAENKGYLGISGRAVSDEMVEVYEFPQGVFVYEVFANSGAEKAGLRKGDIIIKLEGSSIKSMEALQEELAYYEAGETVELTVSRTQDDGTYEDITMQVVLISADEMPAE